MREEAESMGDGEDVERALRAFYEAVKETRRSHAARAGAVAEAGGAFAEEIVEEAERAVGGVFSGEENSGRYLDLHESHATYANATFGERCDYSEYLERCGNFAETPRSKKFCVAYSDYLDALLAYLRSFHERAIPLQFVHKALAQDAEEFERRWKKGECPGWEDGGVRAVDEKTLESSAVDLSAFKSLKDMEKALDVDAIKSALGSLGLKAGGTPEQRAERLWSVKGKKLSEIDRKLFAKGVVLGSASSTSKKNKSQDGEDGDAKVKAENRARAIAFKESQCALVLKLLGKQLDATRTNVEKKSTLSLAELQAEAEEDDDFSDAETDEDEEIYNPLKLPLGWDGKPIPYWLYKLHGLNMEYTCEICGNYSYWGRRAFERHFTEWRHQHGMRCLKIPYTKAFNEVTSIADAAALHKNLSQREVGTFNVKLDAEVEDAQGNVYNKKTYEDLQRQGLL